MSSPGTCTLTRFVIRDTPAPGGPASGFNGYGVAGVLESLASILPAYWKKCGKKVWYCDLKKVPRLAVCMPPHVTSWWHGCARQQCNPLTG